MPHFINGKYLNGVKKGAMRICGFYQLLIDFPICRSRPLVWNFYVLTINVYIHVFLFLYELDKVFSFTELFHVFFLLIVSLTFCCNYTYLCFYLFISGCANLSIWSPLNICKYVFCKIALRFMAIHNSYNHNSI